MSVAKSVAVPVVRKVVHAAAASRPVDAVQPEAFTWDSNAVTWDSNTVDFSSEVAS